MEKNSIRRGVAKKIEEGALIFITVKDFFFASCGLIKCLFLWLRRKKNKDLIYRDVGFVQYSKKKKVHNSDIRPFFCFRKCGPESPFSPCFLAMGKCQHILGVLLPTFLFVYKNIRILVIYVP